MDFLHRRLNIPDLVELIFEFGKYKTEPYLLELEEKILQKTNIDNMRYLPDHLQEKFFRKKVNHQIKYNFLTNLLDKYNIAYHISHRDGSIIGYDYRNIRNLDNLCYELNNYFEINWNSFFKDIGGIKLILYKQLSY